MNYYTKRLFRNEFILTLVSLFLNALFLLVILLTYPKCDCCPLSLLVVRGLLIIALLLNTLHAIRQSQIIKEDQLAVYLNGSKWIPYTTLGFFIMGVVLYTNVIHTSILKCICSNNKIEIICEKPELNTVRDTIIFQPIIQRDTVVLHSVNNCKHSSLLDHSCNDSHTYGCKVIDVDTISVVKIIDALDLILQRVISEKVDTVLIREKVTNIFIKRLKVKKVSGISDRKFLDSGIDVNIHLKDTNPIVMKSVKIKESNLFFNPMVGQIDEK